MNDIVPYLHFIGIMVLTGSLMAMYLILKSGLSEKQVRLASMMNNLFFLSAAVVLATGLLRWFLVGKGAAFYNINPLFHIKITLFVVILILAVFPALKINKWKKLLRQDGMSAIPEKESINFLWFLRIEFLLIAILPLLAVMVARGH